MEDKELLETIERYLTDDMSSQERTQFEALRKTHLILIRWWWSINYSWTICTLMRIDAALQN